MAAREILAGDAQVAIDARAVGEDNRVVALPELVHGDIRAHIDIAEEAESGPGGGLLVDPDDRLDLRVVRRHARADQPERRGEAIEHVHLDLNALLLEQMLGCVEPRRPGADYRHAQGLALCPDVRHGSRKG